MFFVEFNLVLVIIVHVVYSVCLVYTVAIGDFVSFVDIVASGYNVAHVYKALANTMTLASCVYIVAIGLIANN